MEIEVAVMEPKYQINLGYIARVSKNFGVRKLFLVNPRCRHTGKQAIKYSKHARELLQKARICNSISDLDHGFIIGTTGIWHKTGESFYNVYTLEEAGKMALRAGTSGRKVTVLLGRDDTGLTKSELRECDATISLETNKEYPILNISHALAIILYCLSVRNAGHKVSTRGLHLEYRNISTLFKRMVDANPRIKDKASVRMAFQHVIRRASPTLKELNALSIALSPTRRHSAKKRRGSSA